MMRPFTGPLHLFRAFVPCINQGLNVRFSYLTRIRFVGLITGIIIDKIRLIPVEILLQSCQLRAMPFVREIVPQHGQFREGLLGVTMPQFPLRPLQGGGKGLAEGLFHLLKLLRVE
jgi:hypothetical protein